MDKNYVITSNGGFVSEDELAHHGILGMRWGRRRYQNSDGSLTAEGRERYGVSEGRDTRGEEGTGSAKSSTRNSRGTGNSGGRSERANKKEATKAKSAEEKAKKQEEKKAEEKKDDNATNERRTKLDGKSLDEISDKNLNDRLNRMRNEDAYDKMMVERGYVQVEKYSDMDRKISELKKQKEYSDLVVGLDTQTQISELTRQRDVKLLQRDIKNLDKELNAKEKSGVQKLAGKVTDEVLVPSAIDAGRKVLTGWLTKKGMELAGLSGDGAKAAANATKDKVVPKLEEKKDKVVELTKQEMAKEAAKEAREDRGFVNNVNINIVNGDSKDSTSASSTTASDSKKVKIKAKSGYETEVDKLLSEIDDNGWKQYESMSKDKTKTKIVGTDESSSSDSKKVKIKAKSGYETEVDKLLSEIDGDGWKQYESMSKSSDSKKVKIKAKSGYETEVDKLLSEIDDNGWKQYESMSKDKVYEGEFVTGSGKKDTSTKRLNSAKPVVDAEYEVVTDDKKSSTAALGERKVAGYLDSGSSKSTLALGERKVSGYLDAPASTKSSTPSLGERKVAGLLGSGTSKYTRSHDKGKLVTGYGGGRIVIMKNSGNYTNAEIADKLGISLGTLNYYLYNDKNHNAWFTHAANKLGVSVGALYYYLYGYKNNRSVWWW